jgi:hypothetical protein
MALTSIIPTHLCGRMSLLLALAARVQVIKDILSSFAMTTESTGKQEQGRAGGTDNETTS